MMLSGSQILIECLKEQGVDVVFGFPGGTVLNIYDELYKHKNEIRHILTSHEQGAVHAADGYARSTGKTGVCIATSGPGATNLVTGIATAYMDSVPIVAITGNVPLSLLGKDSFQEIDITGITMPITKHNFIVKDITKLADTLRKAFKIASSNRPGPVLVDIVKDVTDPNNKCEFKPIKADEKALDKDKKEIPEEDLAGIVKLIAKSRRPVVVAGGGAVISAANEQLKEFVYKIDAPICDTLMGKGAFDSKEDCYIGMLGMHGTKAANYAVMECDLLIALGVRFSDRIVGNKKKYAKNAKIIHIDIDPAEINKNIRADKSIIGDVSEVLEALNTRIDCYEHSEWMEHVLSTNTQYPLDYDENSLNGPCIIENLFQIVGDNAIITTDVGQHQIWAAQFFKYARPRTFISSGGLGTMGFGLGAAIGAKIGNPDKMVVNISGDGCFRMNMNEIATAVRAGAGIVDIVFNNSSLGMVRQWQEILYGGRYSQTLFEDKIDIAMIAKGLGGEAIEINSKSELNEKLNLACKMSDELNKPIIVICNIHTEDKVWPMVAPGKALSEVFTEDDIY